MCYSAKVRQAFEYLALEYGAEVDYESFENLFALRAQGEKISVSTVLESQFSKPKTAQQKVIKSSIDGFRQKSIQEIEKELFVLRGRAAAAEKKLSAKPTKSAENELGVAQRKSTKLLDKLQVFKSGDSTSTDARIFAFNWTPVMIWRDGKRRIVPMRYHLRPYAAPASFDREYPGCYNARSDNLQGFWKKQFGKTHAVLIVSSFFENVKRHDFERRALKPGEREENIVLQFEPEGITEMLVPCIWDRWAMPKGEGLGSFALITDEPPQEIAETGHNRCPIFLKNENMDSWLQPQNSSAQELLALLKDRQSPRYLHRLAA